MKIKNKQKHSVKIYEDFVQNQIDKLIKKGEREKLGIG